MRLAARARRFLWGHPAWWTVGLTGLGWVYVAVSWLDEHAAHRAQGPGAALLHWLAMVAAMMLPLMWGHVSLVAERSLWRRRHRGMALFLSGYLGVWLLFGVAATVVAGGRGNPAESAGWLGLAAVWQVTRWKRAALRACHRTTPLAPAGWQADVDCLRYGAAQARHCVTSCWALMLACATGQHAWWLMGGLTAFVVAERMADRPRQGRFAGVLLAGAAGAFAVPFLDGLVELRIWQ